MNQIFFVFYYCNLRLGILLGMRHTSQPLNIKWRWRYWQDREIARREHRA
jgi:hypothetical protein